MDTLDNEEVIDYDYLLLHQEEFLTDEEMGIIPPEVLEELMDFNS